MLVLYWTCRAISYAEMDRLITSFKDLLHTMNEISSGMPSLVHKGIVNNNRRSLDPKSIFDPGNGVRRPDLPI